MGAKQCAQRLPNGSANCSSNWGHGDQSAREELIPWFMLSCAASRAAILEGTPQSHASERSTSSRAYLHLLHEEPPNGKTEPTFFGLPRN